jgi:hypothetical protein
LSPTSPRTAATSQTRRCRPTAMAFPAPNRCPPTAITCPTVICARNAWASRCTMLPSARPLLTPMIVCSARALLAVHRHPAPRFSKDAFRRTRRARCSRAPELRKGTLTKKFSWPCSTFVVYSLEIISSTRPFGPGVRVFGLRPISRWQMGCNYRDIWTSGYRVIRR